MAAVAGYNSSFLVTSLPSVSFSDVAMTDSGDHTTYTLSDATKRYLDKSQTTTVQQANDELQSVTITGSPTGGVFTLTFGAQTTTGIAYNAAASAVQSALQALSSIGSGNALVTGANGGPWQVQFTASLGQASQSLLTKDATGLTGGTSPNVAIARVQAGAAFATISSGFTLRYAGAVLIYNSAQPVGTYVRIHAGYYYPYTTIGGASSAEFNGKVDLQDTTAFNTTGTHAFTPCLMNGTLKLSDWWANTTLIAHLSARDLLVVSFVSPTGARYEGYSYMGDNDLKVEVSKALAETITFQLTDQFFAN